ncbi:MAG: hydrogenase maturation protease [Anaerolineae bacterium]|nr:hydrogenase maturation protease [Anaerolineae bacterium]
MATLVIGLGNPLLTDDGVGVLTARAVQDALAAHPVPNVEVVEAGVGGLRLMELMVGCDRAILIDAWTDAELPPGAVRRLTLADLEAIRPPQHLASAHDATLPTALAAGRRLGLKLPEDIVIIAVAVSNVTDFGETPTPPVLAAVPQAAAIVLAELRGAAETQWQGPGVAQ